jgi:hypothetical protein
VIPPNFDRARLRDLIPALWPGVVVKDIKVVYRPVWVAVVQMGKKRYKVFLDAVTGVVEKEVPLVGDVRGRA